MEQGDVLHAQPRASEMKAAGGLSLSPEECEVFRSRGYVGPFALCSPEEMAALSGRIEREVRPMSADKTSLGSRHTDSRLVYDLCAHPALVGRLTSLIGPDILLRSSNFWLKEQGAAEIPWHQDIANREIPAPFAIAAWLAIDEATTENACLEMIPGSHTFTIPLVPSQGSLYQHQMKADPRYVDTSKSVPIQLKPGQFIIFSELLLHRSAPNLSPKRRMGLGMRFTASFVKIVSNEWRGAHRYVCMLISGEDRFGLNELTPPPSG